jgi:nickel/cobalt exporter
MSPFAEVLQQGIANAWLFIPSAILLGALHGLEPGHSKTMMAAFIVAIRGTVKQAVLLGLAATLSHTSVVWGVALGGLYFWRSMDAEEAEPYFQLASAVIIIGVALWMLARTRRDNQRAKIEVHEHRHGHEKDIRRIDTGHGVLAVSISEEGAPHWRLKAESGHGWTAQDVALETERPDGQQQSYSFLQHKDYLESNEAIPEPHEFMARIRLTQGDHTHSYDVPFIEEDHGHDHLHEELRGLDVSTGGYRDAHELAHANDIRRRFADRDVTTGQIILFGLTGGLIPCPAAITVLLLCLQLKELALGAALVMSFSVGLAITLLTVGAAAALSVRHATKRYAWFGAFMRKAPYFSGTLILVVGIYMAFQGWFQLAAHGIE